VGGNRKTCVVVGCTCPEIIEPFWDVGGSNQVVERTLWEVIHPCEPEGRRFRREGGHEIVVVDTECRVVAFWRPVRSWRNHKGRFRNLWLGLNVRSSWRGSRGSTTLEYLESSRTWRRLGG